MNLFMGTNWSTPEELVGKVLNHCCKDEYSSVKYEIERKWLATKDTVNWLLNEAKMIRPPHEQGEFKVRYVNSIWVSVDPEVRVRAYYSETHRLELYKICYKGSPEQAGLKRPEAECECTEEVFLKALEMASQTAHPYRGNLILPMKFWLWTPYQGYTYEVKSMDYGAQYQLEIETKTVEQAEGIKLPIELENTLDWEVTNSKKHALKNYWQKTRMK